MTSGAWRVVELLERFHSRQVRFFDPPVDRVPLPLFDLGRQQNFQIPGVCFLLPHRLLGQSAELRRHHRHAQRFAVLLDGGLLELRQLAAHLATSCHQQLVVFVHHRQGSLIPFQRSDVDRLTGRTVQVRRMKQMLHRGGVRAASRQRRLDRRSQPAVAILFGQFQQIDHLPGPVLLAMPHVQRLPHRIETLRPESGSALLFQWPRSGQCPRLPRQHVQVMLQFEHLFLPAIAALMQSHAPPVTEERGHRGCNDAAQGPVIARRWDDSSSRVLSDELGTAGSPPSSPPRVSRRRLPGSGRQRSLDGCSNVPLYKIARVASPNW